ncbi:hypothetical protein [Sphingopyxis sp. BSNA05]|uniref:hypothetical protein n=1 Tax=Sphingopyxis sp. BSNA05 TaxID=1236614 RepID=UPI001566D40A|nr:hypothetical protein [Sphingopyxis sp. BSNA05]
MRNRYCPTIALAASVSLLSACTSTAPGSAARTSHERADIAIAPVDASAVMRAADAIAAGQVAADAADAAALRIAAQMLENLGARPAGDQQENLSRSWNQRASLIDPSVAPPVYRGRALGPSYKRGWSRRRRGSVSSRFFWREKRPRWRWCLVLRSR